MRVFSLSTETIDLLGFDDGGDMLDLTRAVMLHELTRDNPVIDEPVSIEDLMLNDRFNTSYISEVMDTVGRYGMKGDLTVTDEYFVNPPVWPGKIIAIGQNYKKHIEEMGHSMPDRPVIFGKWPSIVIAHEEEIIRPASVERVDYEAELAVIIGSMTKNVPPEVAMNSVAGYTCLNDVTARSVQSRDMATSLPWMSAKNYDTFCPLGPCVLLSGAVPEPVDIDVQSRVNGELRQNGNTRDFLFDIPTMVSYISEIMTLEPGDVISTGTPMGVGPLVSGDVVEVSCSGIGVLQNPVVASDEV